MEKTRNIKKGVKTNIVINRSVKDLLVFLLAGGYYMWNVYVSAVSSDAMAFFPFCIGACIIYLWTLDWKALSFYFLMVGMQYYSLQTSVAFLPQFSVYSIIKVYFIILTIYYAIKSKIKKNKSQYMLSVSYAIIWLLYFAVEAAITSTSFNNVWYSIIIIVGTIFQYMIDENDRYKRYYLISLICSGIFLAVCFFYELYTGQSVFYMSWAGERYRNGILRVGGFQGDPNAVAMYAVPLIFILLMPLAGKIVSKGVCRMTVALLILVVILSGSRTSQLAMVIGFLIIIYYYHRNIRLIAVFIGIGFGGIILAFLWNWFYNLDTSSSALRIYLDFKAIEIWRESVQNFLFGIGNGNFVKRTYWLTMNEWMRQLTEFGLFGFLLYCMYYIKGIRMIVLKKNGFLYQKKVIGEGIYIIAALLGYAVISFSMDSFSHFASWLFPAMLVVLQQQKQEISIGD